MSPGRPALGVGLVALLASCGAEPRPPCTGSTASAELATVCGFAKPEDVEAVPARSLVLVSEMGWDAPARGGALSALVLDANGRPLADVQRLWPEAPAATAPDVVVGDPACRLPPDADAFSAHGLAARAEGDAVRVAVVAHGAREAIELFELRGAGGEARLAWRGCVPLPPDTAGNDVALHADGRLFVTNYIPTVHGLGAWLALRRGQRGEATGDVLVWSRAGGWSHLAGTEMAIPNGIALSADGSSLWVAENGAQRIARFSLGEAGAGERRDVPLRGAPDNLSWSTEGALLAVVLDPTAAGAWWLEAIDPGTLATRVVFESRGAELRSVTSVADAGSTLVFGSYQDDRVGLLGRRP
jgi:SMP-30/Gluconolactonase/LRE-like region